MSGFIRVMGMLFALNSKQEVKRAKRLMRKNPKKYLVDSNLPSGISSPKPLLHYIANPSEGELILTWVRTGTGEEPS